MSAKNCLEEEIDNALSHVDAGGRTARNIRILKHYYGLDGKGGASMEAVARPHNMTRESVRQIINRCLAVIASRQFHHQCTNFPVLRAVVKRIRKLLPIAASDLSEILRKEGYVRSAFGAVGILNAIDIFGLDAPAISRATIGEEVFLLPEGMQLSDARATLSRVTKEVSHNGICDIRRLVEMVPEGSYDNKLRFIRALIATRPAHRYVDERQYWVYFGREGRNRLLNRLDRVFSFVESATLADLVEGIARSWKKNPTEHTAAPPRNVLAMLLEDLGVYSVSGSAVSCSANGAAADLGEMECAMAQFIADSDNGIRHEKEMEDYLVQHPSKKRAFSMALNFSPLIIRKSRGQYRLVGKARSF